MAELGELPDERVGDLPRQLAPVLLHAGRKDLGELRDAEVGEIDEARGVVDEEAEGHPPARIEDLHALGGGGAVAARSLLHLKRGKLRPGQGEGRRLEKFATEHHPLPVIHPD
jgi:hypothetical protein